MISLFLDKVRRTLLRYSLLSRGDRVVVAVSGGPDSVCLLDILVALAPEYGLSLHVAHLDHGFRGSESAEEARFVTGLAEDRGIPATVEKRAVRRYCAEHGLSVQTGARDVRYAFLGEAGRSFGATRIALGHTANDQAETLLMRLIRGAGLAGLAGIPPKRDLFIRPLLEVSRGEIMEYIDARGLRFVTDPSNDRPVCTRNRVRQEILPVLERFNPRIVETLAAEAGVIHDEDLAAEAAVTPAVDRVLRTEKGRTIISRGEFLGLAPAYQRRVLRKAVGCLAEGTTLTSLQTREILEFLGRALTGRRIALPPDLEVERQYDSFILRRRQPSSGFCVPLQIPGTTVLPSLSLEVAARVAAMPSPSREEGNYLWQAAFDYDKITPPLQLRSRRDGDRLHPAGMAGKSKKLQDLFVDGRIPRADRDRVPLLAADRDILWVVGIRADERFLAGPATKQLLLVTVRSLNGEP